MRNPFVKFGVLIFIIFYIIIHIFLLSGAQEDKQKQKIDVVAAIEHSESEEKPYETNDEAVVEKVTVQSLVDLGEFKITAYCSCRKCCGKWADNRPKDKNGNEIIYGSIGTRLTAGLSIAVDPNVIPYESTVIINGHTYIAHDTGGAIKGNRIDVYFDDHQEALNFGVQYANVYIVQ